MREIYGAPTRAAAEMAIDVFADKYGAKYDKAVACLTKDREALLAFFDFPAEHWDHLRTSNPIESVFATVRHRTVRTKGALSAKTAKLMVFKLVNAASSTWRRLNGENQLPKVDQGVQISHEAIYRSLFNQTRGVLKKELAAHLRTARRMRRPKSHNTKSGQGHIVDMVSIRERPAEVEDRAVPGHWEGDLLTGANDTHIATLVERNTRFTMLVRIPRKDTTTVVAMLAKHIRKLPKELRRSLTWDQGKEMHAHKRFTVATDVQVYFCEPRSPWQRGSNENTNGLLRQYFPRGTDFSRISQSYLNAIALQLNQRPRKTLGFETPADRLQAVLH